MATRRAPLWRVAAAAAILAGTASAGAIAQETHTINLKDADIHALIEDISAVTGFTFVTHPLVKGRVTVTSQAPLTKDEIFQVFLSTLRVHGFVAIPSTEGTYRIVPDERAVEDNTSFGSVDLDDQFVTEVIRLRHFSAIDAANMVKPLVNGRGQVTANAASNVLVVADFSGNISRIRKIVGELDQDRSVLETIKLENMPAVEMARVINGLRERGNESLQGQFLTVAVESGNTLLVRGDEAVVQRVNQVVRRLDEGSKPSETLRVVYLKHADAEEIVPILEQVATSMRPAGATGGEMRIPFHAETNALILSGDPNTLAALERVVGELDIRRAQVLVEAIVVEISDQAARELGLQFILSGNEDSSVPFAVTNFSRSAPNLLAVTGALINDETDVSSDASIGSAALSSLLGLEGISLGVGGQSSDGTLFGVILNAVQDDQNSNLLSTPSVMTLDNQEARISVGQEIPITTGEALGSDFANPFRTIQRQDVGVQLEVRPQINEGDSIKLYLRQEVSSILGAAVANASDIITNKREIETTVLADDGEIIVLGGLIEEQEVNAESKVPLLGDVPLAGRLFRSEGREVTKKNLMVFIRPTIVRDVADARDVTTRKYNFAVGQEADRNDTALEELLLRALGE